LKHYASARFWQYLEALPAQIQTLARRNYALLRENASHPSLQFKPLGGGRLYSVRVGLHYRALGVPIDGGIQRFWIGSHAEYDRLIN
jgi:hypothetical protein